jgi:GNAT superfamily N-acetyltransferase
MQPTQMPGPRGIPVRRANADDAIELSRLREVMFASYGPVPDRSLWWDAAVKELEQALADPEGPLQSFVVDAPAAVLGRADGAVAGGAVGGSAAGWRELASCAVAIIDRRLPSPHNPIGYSGYVLSVATDPRHRRRGYARAVMQATLDWFESCGIQRVELHASAEAEPLYRALGFLEPHGLALTRWTTQARS